MIDEGIGNLVLGVVSTIAPGVAAPRDGTFRAAVLTEAISGNTTMLPLEEDSADDQRGLHPHLHQYNRV